MPRESTHSNTEAWRWAVPLARPPHLRARCSRARAAPATPWAASPRARRPPASPPARAAQ
eukprot:7381744-Prymnesium_polylepis.1